MTNVFNLFTSEMKFPFDRFEDFVTCAWKNYYTGYVFLRHRVEDAKTLELLLEK